MKLEKRTELETWMGSPYAEDNVSRIGCEVGKECTFVEKVPAKEYAVVACPILSDSLVVARSC